jgi:hypothetical protein
MKTKRKFQHILNFTAAFIFLFTTAFGQTKPEMRYQDKIRIREAMNISKQFGDQIWKGINDVPFVILLVTDSTEFLVNHPYPSDDFKLLGIDSILETNIYYRPTQYNIHFLATFPAVNGVTCIVVGVPENTIRNSTTNWTITLLHEHFHQYQVASVDYYKSVENLGLTGGDQTGMWMLNYPFPYDSTIIIEQYKKYTMALSKALASIGTKEIENNFNNYKTERNKFKKLLNPTDYRYFSFQVWQEGIANYTEYKFLEFLSDYKPSEEISQLSDFVSFNKYKEEFYKSQSNQLIQLGLKEDKRICFYAIGFAEGLLLDRLNPKWHKDYLINKFYIEQYSDKFK